jgi:ATP-dependent Clp protease ATP-binding subunit ClpA
MTNKKIEEYKAPCEMLGRILTVKKLNKKQINAVIEKLKKLVNNAKPGNKSVLEYVRTVIQYTLPPTEQVEIAKLLKAFNVEVATDLIAVQNVLASIYNAIVDIYQEMRIEFVCADLNGMKHIVDTILDPMNLDDTEFQQYVKKETTKKSKKLKQYDFSTIEQIEALEIFLKKNVIGQDDAVKVVCDAVKLKSVGFAKTVNLFFVGKTGRGKTELARLLGQQYSNNFWIINCAEFSNGHEVNRLLGAPPGYIGHSDKSLMKEKSEKSNKWVIVFDEIEKAHDKFYNFLLALMETGECYDNIGTKIDFSESIFIFTSNCGLKDLKTKSTSFHYVPNIAATKEELMTALEKQFSPEFRNRIDEFVFFNNLTKDDAKKIVDLRLRDFPIKKTPEIVSYVVDNGFSDEFGARELTRFIKKNIALPLANSILAKKVPESGKSEYEMVVNSGKIEVINTVASDK